MKNLLLFALVVSLAACSTSDDPAVTPTNNNTNTFLQDSRLMGTWRADSCFDSTSAITHIGRGNHEIGDSVIFSPVAFNGNTPIVEVSAWWISGPTIMQLPKVYFWETVNDSLYFEVLNHSYNAMYRFGFSVSGNILRVEFRHNYTNGSKHEIGYYHKN